MNEQHRVLCVSEVWSGVVEDQMLPWVLEGLDSSTLGDNMIDIARRRHRQPGRPRRTTDIVRTRTARLTVVEIDDDLAGLLATRFADTVATPPD